MSSLVWPQRECCGSQISLHLTPTASYPSYWLLLTWWTLRYTGNRNLALHCLYCFPHFSLSHVVVLSSLCKQQTNYIKSTNSPSNFMIGTSCSYSSSEWMWLWCQSVPASLFPGIHVSVNIDLTYLLASNLGPLTNHYHLLQLHALRRKSPTRAQRMMTYTFRFLSVGMGYIGSQMPAVSYLGTLWTLNYLCSINGLTTVTSPIHTPHTDFLQLGQRVAKQDGTLLLVLICNWHLNKTCTKFLEILWNPFIVDIIGINNFVLYRNSRELQNCPLYCGWPLLRDVY